MPQSQHVIYWKYIQNRFLGVFSFFKFIMLQIAKMYLLEENFHFEKKIAALRSILAAIKKIMCLISQSWNFIPAEGRVFFQTREKNLLGPSVRP